MIVRLTLIFGIFLFSSSCGTSQGPNPLTSYPFVYQKLSPSEKEKLMNEVKAKYETLLGKKGFSGQILVAKNGQVVFEDYQGYANYSNKTLIQPETPIHLASISKTFTAMAALKLWEQEKIRHQSTCCKIFKQFSIQGSNYRAIAFTS